MAVLGPKENFQFIGIDKSLNASDISERRVHTHITRCIIFLGQQIRKFLQALNRLKVVVMHLPVATDQWLSNNFI
jgi:hypothetical protein